MAETHADAFAMVLAELRLQPGEGPRAVAHRVVHGGELAAATIVDDAVEAAIEASAVFAPAHNPAALAGIRVARQHFPDAVHVAVFDTAFHAGLPEVARIYPLPGGLSVGGLPVRRYGFHGINCAWCLGEVTAFLGRPAGTLNLIVAHLGSGASVSAIRDGRSVDTSMGMTPLEGVMMQRRSGDIDPAIVIHLARAGQSPDDIETLLNERAGVFAVAGEAEIARVAARAREGDANAALARAMYAYRMAKYIGAYAGAVWPLDAIVFTAGVGENDADIRSDICRALPQLGIELDAAANGLANGAVTRRISAGGGPAVLVVPANEELQMARETAHLLRLASKG